MRTLSVYAPSYAPYDGYGRMALELLEKVSAMGVHVNAMGTPNLQLDYPEHTPAQKALINKPIHPTVGGLMVGYPTLRQKYPALMGAGPTVALTMFESTKLPEGWVASLNQCQAVIVPVKWCEKAFRRCGVHVPIHVVPLGVSKTFYYVDRGIRQPSQARPYTFLAWGDRGTRKGWDVAVNAFLQTFGPDRTDVQLLIKTRKDAFSFRSDISNIHVVDADMDETQLMDFYKSVDCMVFPSRGEGFGLPPREFAATGGAVIATEWWADDIQQWGYPLRYKMVDAWQDHEKFAGLGKWAEPDVNHLIEQMQHVVNQNPALMRYMGKRSAQRAQKLYQWEQFAEKVWQIYSTVKPNLADKRQARRERKHGNRTTAGTLPT